MRPWRASDGEIGGIILFSEIVTRNKRAMDSLHASQRLLESIVNSIPAGVFWKDRNLNYLGCNDTFAKDAGFSSAAEVVGKDDFRMNWRGLAERYRKDDLEVIETGVAKLLAEDSRTGPDGSAVTLLASKTPLRDASGEVAGVVGAYFDITERKRIAESRERLGIAVEQADETIVITDTSGSILYANPAFERATGFSREEALGKNPRILKSGVHDAEFYRRMWEVLQRGEIWKGHMVNRRKDGTLYEEVATITPVRDPNGVCVNYVAVKRDVTREKQLEAQFLQSQKMESIGLLAGGVAHDFNNLLTAIMMQAEMAILAENLPAEAKGCIEGIVDAAKRAAGLTRQLLLFSRKHVMQARPIDLNAVVASMIKILRRTIPATVAIETRLHSAPVITLADEGMIDQVLMNLAVNARDAMENGGVLSIETSLKTIGEDEASAAPDGRPGQFACLIIRDTGCGIPAEIRLRIFEPFFTTKDPAKGTGLGLASVFGIVKQHGGWMKVESEVGQGTAFHLFFPASEAQAGAGTRAAQPFRGIRGSETILLVEDDRPVRQLTRAALERNGYHILEAENGADAQRVWKEHSGEIAMLLTDLVLPAGMSGFELARRIREENPGLKALFMSGYAPEIAGRAPELRPDENFIQKPCPAVQLLEAVRNCLDGKPVK